VGEAIPLRHAWANNPIYYHGERPDYVWQYEPWVYYSFVLYDVHLRSPNTTQTQSIETLKLNVYHPNGHIQMTSEDLNPIFFVEFEKLKSFYYKDWSEYAQCTLEFGCNQKATSASEYYALVQFANAFQYKSWRTNKNWLDGDPCLNYWYGVGCNIYGHIISLHFFENKLVGYFDPSIQNLIYLKSLCIFNGQQEFEWTPNSHANVIRNGIPS
jgi:hypothetical protein